VNTYIGLFLLVLAAVYLASFITGTLSKRMPHLGIPDQ
jgi:hypothetical protein